MAFARSDLSGVCRWLEWTNAHEEGPDQVRQMLAGVACGAPTNVETIWSNQSGIAIRRGSGNISLGEARGLLAVVQGRPHWRSNRLASLADQQGAAIALIHAYNDHGLQCLRHLGGAFSLAVIDGQHASGFLAIDRMGVNTMSFAQRSGQLVFGSSAETVAAHPSVGRHVSTQALFNYLFCHVVPSPGTIYCDIEKLLPGQCLSFGGGTVERQFYWEIAYNDTKAEPFDVLRDRFHALLRDALKRAIGADDAVGAFLSGGTDSSTVTGVLTELRGKGAKTYSIGFAARGYDEMEYARITARHFVSDAREYYVTPSDVVAAIPVIARSYDEPFGNESAVPTYFCARMASADGVDVMLAGDGGDELFGGNARYARQRIFELYGCMPQLLRERIIEPWSRAAGTKLAPLRKLRSYIEQASVPLPERLESYNFLYRTALSDVFDPDFLKRVDVDEPRTLQREVYERARSSSPINKMMHLDLKFTLADNDLRKVSRMCEVAGVEARYPLLDDALVEFSAELPASLKVRGLTLRYFFKQALKDFLPPETIGKHKHGFGLPFGLWLGEHAPLAELARDSLHAFARRGVVTPAYIAELLHQHESGHATYFGVMIWVIMMLEQWLSARNL